MCGICGFAGFEDKALAAKMAQTIAHRGPDGHGVYSAKGVTLAHNRLAIIDLSARGKQPMSNDEGTTWVSFNGEIYNFRELRSYLERRGHRFKSDSDTEVLVRGYDTWGERFAERLRGDFAFALWDSNAKKLLLARDFPGVDPLYYYFDSKRKRLYFASEIKALFAAGVPRRVNCEAVNDFLSLQRSIGPQTLFDGVFKVQPGEMVSFENGILRRKKFASLPQPEVKRDVGMHWWVLEAKKRFMHSVERRLLSDVPLGVFLSGGLDSSLTAAAMSSLRDNVKTFSVNFGGNSEDEKYSRLVAEELGTEHTELHVNSANCSIFPQVAWHLDEPAVDIAALPTYLMAREAKKHVSVILTGDGGDEVFGGYGRYSRLGSISKWSWAARHLKHLPLGLNSFGDAARAKELLAESHDRAKLMLSYSSALSEGEKKSYSKKTLKDSNRTLEKMRLFFPPVSRDRRDFARQMMDFDLLTLLPDDYLMKVNKASLAWALEPRVPFLDRDFIAFTQSIPSSLKVRGRHTKILLRKVVASTRLPKALVKRRKQGFNVPTREWLRGELKDIAAQMLSDSQVEKRGLVDKKFARMVLENAPRTETLWGKRFWTLFSLEAWHRIFIDPQRVSKPRGFKDLGV
ncbi:TPA: asparagine synthase (glutamine-hydrolyzing) [Candidatus Micrarchaeota archaeon]|nr:asparagine synthase (glutamine-hydrolyzing) [Candidatus Micrarchaeota archaeon]